MAPSRSPGAGAIEGLAWLAADADARPPLRKVLAEALGDRSVELLRWGPEAGSYVDGDGRGAALPRPGSSRAVVEVAVGDRRLGAIVHDAALATDPRLLQAARRLATVALGQERVTAELQSSRERSRVSRSRFLEAADEERRRIARDLHDGLQVRLVVLAVQADRARADRNPSTAVHDDVAKLHAGLLEAIAHLRALVAGVMPPALAERGLDAAVEDLIDGIPIPTELDVDDRTGRLPGAVESTGYFVISEALANAVKHSHASELAVGLRREADRLRIEVSDDGTGGARWTGRGIHGMADRVNAIGGHLLVDSPPGGGTRVVAEVPCAF